MLRRALTAASSARAPSSIVASISSCKLPLTRPSWHLVREPRKQENRTAPASYLQATKAKLTANLQQSPSTTRLFTTTPFTAFTASPPTKDPSPFRLSANKTDSSTPPSFEDVYYSPYKPKRQWPPDMSKLSPKHQFRLERKYRRRAALKYARPTFMKAVTIGQWIVIGFVIIYSVLFMEWETNDTPFHGIRESFFAGLRAIFSSAPPPGARRDQKDNTASEESQ
ncbi:uncharacterized protein N7479_002250 [Penicillium vulpinum]|uniref:Uncharacterized protein n=1 Tax=Penicillium vulpinum TaxID=29845 RepID=A0A1V6S7L6_9EURO|nr:uncharacterized protein N7479_002250 [Penicillium vulpinum]KAJ5972332.1 hypothetical protein N7479_002250 [Penicillium vulpinum]OQE09760.1 hypothetical protein PENVUL_c005G09373 [Penicillium vulpinum]